MSRKIVFCDLAAQNAPIMPEIAKALQRVAESGRYVGGAEVSSLEEKLRCFAGAGYCIGTGNGLDALRLVMRAWVSLGKLNRGDEVIVAANTYIASLLAMEDAGLVPRPVDPDEKTMLLDANGIERAMTKRVKAVMPVHLYGRTDWSEEIASVAEQNRLLVIEDNAQGIGCRWNGRCAGTFGDAGALSFYPTKNIGALGDAGAVLTDDRDLADAVRALGNYGSDSRYHNIYATGCNSRMDPMQAAVLKLKLEKIETVSARRRHVATMYDRMIENSGVMKPEVPEDPEEHVWHQYVVRLPDRKSRDDFRRYMMACGIETDIHYAVPPHMQPCYQSRAWARGHFPVTCRIADTVVSLPIATVTDEDVARVAEAVNAWDST